MKGIALEKKVWELSAQSYHDTPDFDVDGMQVCYYFSDNINFLIWPGSNELGDWLLRNFYFFAKKEKGFGKFHRGYWNGIKDHHSAIYQLIPEENRELPLVVGGHSAGGAWSQLFLLKHLSRVDMCITFGSPKPIKKLDSEFHENIVRDNSVHYINPLDPVTDQPPWWKLIGKEVVKKIKNTSEGLIRPEHSISIYGKFFE